MLSFGYNRRRGHYCGSGSHGGSVSRGSGGDVSRDGGRDVSRGGNNYRGTRLSPAFIATNYIKPALTRLVKLIKLALVKLATQ
jgi:hypothetical protein